MSTILAPHSGAAPPCRSSIAAIAAAAGAAGAAA